MVLPYRIGFSSLALAFLMAPTAQAQATLTQAQVYTLQNQVTLNRQNQGTWQPATVGDEMVPQDALRTGGQSRAELLFNEGTLVRTGENTTFRFPPGRRSGHRSRFARA